MKSALSYFIDPSIGTAILGLGPKDLLKDLNTMGLFFEALCVRDLRVFAEAIDGEVYHFRDKNGLECDAVVHLRNGKYSLKIKLGGDRLFNEGTKKQIINKFKRIKVYLEWGHLWKRKQLKSQKCAIKSKDFQQFLLSSE